MFSRVYSSSELDEVFTIDMRKIYPFLLRKVQSRRIQKKKLQKFWFEPSNEALSSGKNASVRLLQQWQEELQANSNVDRWCLDPLAHLLPLQSPLPPLSRLKVEDELLLPHHFTLTLIKKFRQKL